VLRTSSLAALVAGASLVFGACAAEDPAPSSGSPPAAEPDDASGPNGPNGASAEGGSSVPDADAAPDDSVAVGHERELRGAWISTVFNGTWPSTTGLSEGASKAELTAILDAFVSARMNAVFFQVRPESDAVYASALEPWSRFLTGKQGQDPGWDPLAFVVEEGHRRGLEVHAWMNPYRGLTNFKVEAAPSHITKTLASAVRPYGNLLWMDPGVAEVRARVIAVVQDILTRYDVDGIHFDDYFYPYPVKDQTFDDSTTYAAYTKGGGALSKDDWRRHNVDELIRETSEAVTKTRPNARFGVSPFGIYRPGMPPGITGLDAYAVLYCDPVRWMNEAWVDYLAPQLYWPTTQTAQAFGKLLTWWAGIAKPGRSIFVGHDATKAGDGAFSLDEYDAQMKLVAAERKNGARGSIFFSAKPLVTDQAGLRTALATKHWVKPAATPPLAIAALEPAGPAPHVVVGNGKVAVSTPANTRAIVVYRAEGDAPAIERIVGVASSGGQATEVTLGQGRWAVSILDRRGVESRGARVAIP